MRRSQLAACLLLPIALTGCDDPALAVRGDSTAIASRDGLAKIWNLSPAWDSKRWWVIAGKSFLPQRAVFNDGVGGQSIRTMKEKMLADSAHRALPTVIYDRRNDGEDAAAYVADLREAVATLTTRDFLILPQVPKSAGFPESAEQSAAMAEIDRMVLDLWPNNTFTPAERQAFLTELQPDETRLDGLHRNEKGQAIEAKWVGAWLHRRLDPASADNRSTPPAASGS
jgi:hypothetical protein